MQRIFLALKIVVFVVVLMTTAMAQVAVTDRIFLVEDPQANFIDFQMIVQAGCADEAVTCRGIAHYVEHLVLSGRDAIDQSKALTAFAGMTSNGWTTAHATGYTHRIPLTGRDYKTELERLFAFYAARLRPLTFPKDQVERERQVVLQEHDWRLGSNPFARLVRTMDRQLLPEHPLGRWPIGEREEIMSLTLDDALAFHRKWYRVSNVVFVVKGNVTPKAVEEIAARSFPDIAVETEPVRRLSDAPIAVRNDRIDVVFQDKQASKPAIVVRKLIQLPQRDVLSEAAAVTVMNQLLGSRLPGSFYDYVVEQKKFRNEQLAVALVRLQPGSFVLDLRADVAEGVNTVELAAAIDEFINGAAALVPTERTIQRMRQRALDAEVANSKSPAQVYSQLVQWLAVGRRFKDFGSMPIKLSLVSTRDIQSIYEAISQPGRTVSGVLSPSAKGKP